MNPLHYYYLKQHQFTSGCADSLFTCIALDHALLAKVSVRLPTQWTTEALVALLVAAVAHAEVAVPARTLPRPRGTRPTVLTYTAVLQHAVD